MELLAFLQKDARLVVRNRPLLATLLIYPFLLALVLGVAFQEPPTRLDLAVVDLDASGETVEVGGTPVGVADLLQAADGLADVQRPTSEAAALAILRAGEVDAVLIIPPAFMSDLSALGNAATLRLVVDESDPVRAQVARNAIEGAINAFVDRIVEKKIADVVELLRLTNEGGDVPLLGDILGIEGSIARLKEAHARLANNSAEASKVQEVIEFLGFAQTFLGSSENFLTTTAVPVRVQNEGLSAREPTLASVVLPGALVLGVFWTGSLTAALLAARERETGAHLRLAAAPHARWAQKVSKTLVSLLAALVPAAIVMILGVVALGAVVVDPVTTILALALTALVAAAVGGLAAAVTRGTGSAALLAVLALLPMLLMGGLFYPVAYMPPAAQAIARILPVTLATDALRGAMLRGSTLVELAPVLAGLVAVALVCASGIWLFGRRGP